MLCFGREYMACSLNGQAHAHGIYVATETHYSHLYALNELALLKTIAVIDARSIEELLQLADLKLL